MNSDELFTRALRDWPDDAPILSEAARRLRRRQGARFGGRAKDLKPCAKCGVVCGARERRLSCAKHGAKVDDCITKRMLPEGK
jgi:hypothetical protein